MHAAAKAFETRYFSGFASSPVGSATQPSVDPHIGPPVDPILSTVASIPSGPAFEFSR
jgi:hypothetical protein